MRDVMIHEFDAVRDFVLRFRDAEHAAYRAYLLEPDFAQFVERRRELERFAPVIRLSSQMPRWEEDPLPPPEEAAQTLRSEYTPRRLLRLEAYTLPDGRRIYAACMGATYTLSSTGRPPDKVAVCYLVARDGDGWQIISRRSPPNPAFPYWETTGGEDIALPDEPNAAVDYQDEE